MLRLEFVHLVVSSINMLFVPFFLLFRPLVNAWANVMYVEGGFDEAYED